MSRATGEPELAARVRAARAYAGREQKELADMLEMSVGTYKRIEQEQRGVSKPERAKIAAFCGVPVSFMEEGFDALIIVSNDVLARRVLEQLRDLRVLIESQNPNERLMHALQAARSALDQVAAPTQ